MADASGGLSRTAVGLYKNAASRGGWRPWPALPPYSGSYSVGVVDIEWPDPRGSGGGGGAAAAAGGGSEGVGAGVAASGCPPCPASHSPTILARLYYPSPSSSSSSSSPSVNPAAAGTSSSSNTGGSSSRGGGGWGWAGVVGGGPQLARWLPHWWYGGGYGDFMRANFWMSAAAAFPLLGWLRMPAQWMAQVLRPLPEPATAPDRWPIVIFSHGLAGMRTTYSHICGDLASHGLVVVAMEHRDGSACITAERNGAERLRYRRALPGPQGWDFRNGQLHQRTWEVWGALGLLHRLDQGQVVENMLEDGLPASKRFDWQQFCGLLDLDRIAAAGHSFGAATALTALQRKRHPFRCGIALDAWMWPMVSEPHLTTPVLGINSETFHWKENVKAMHDLHDAGHDNSLFLTLNGTSHQNQSDMPLLTTAAMRAVRMAGPQDPLRALELNNWAMMAFMKREMGLDWLQVQDLDVVLDNQQQQQGEELGSSAQPSGTQRVAAGRRAEVMVGFDGLYHRLGVEPRRTRKA